MLTTREGRAIRFQATDVRVFKGRNSTGVRGVRLAEGDEVVSMAIIRHFEATSDERAAYLKMRRAVAGAPEEEAEDRGRRGGDRLRELRPRPAPLRRDVGGRGSAAHHHRQRRRQALVPPRLSGARPRRPRRGRDGPDHARRRRSSRSSPSNPRPGDARDRRRPVDPGARSQTSPSAPVAPAACASSPPPPTSTWSRWR